MSFKIDDDDPSSTGQTMGETQRFRAQAYVDGNVDVIKTVHEHRGESDGNRRCHVDVMRESEFIIVVGNKAVTHDVARFICSRTPIAIVNVDVLSDRVIRKLHSARMRDSGGIYTDDMYTLFAKQDSRVVSNDAMARVEQVYFSHDVVRAPGFEGAVCFISATSKVCMSERIKMLCRQKAYDDHGC